MSSAITFTVPLPPGPLRSNNRCNWRKRFKVKQQYSETVYAWACDSFHARVWMALEPLKCARVTFTWRACKLPDQANVLPNCKALLDILCMAPKTTQPNGTTYLGIIEDDKGVEAVGRVEKVPHRHNEGVLVEIAKLDEHEWCHPEFHRCDGGGPGEYARYVKDENAR